MFMVVGGGFHTNFDVSYDKPWEARSFPGCKKPDCLSSAGIILPGQSVARNKDGLAVNNRHQTLKELLTQLTHHNDHVRRGAVMEEIKLFISLGNVKSTLFLLFSTTDAILGIKDLLARHPKELSINAVTLVEKLSARMTDLSKSVREVLLDLMRTTIYAGLPQVELGRFLQFRTMFFFQKSILTMVKYSFLLRCYFFLCRCFECKNLWHTFVRA